MRKTILKFCFISFTAPANFTWLPLVALTDCYHIAVNFNNDYRMAIVLITYHIPWFYMI